MTEKNNYDVIIIGGSYAGLASAMSLGRSTRKVLIIDSRLPCNRQTPHSHNFITHDGESPAAINQKAKDQVLKYDTITYHEDVAVQGVRIDKGFEIHTASSKTFGGKKLIFATGITDIMPDIKGFEACWGISVIHCPYCHGFEFRQQKTGLLANGERAYHLTSLIHNLTQDLSILTSGKAEFTAEQLATIKNHNIPLIEKEIIEIIAQEGQIQQVVFQDGSTLTLDALYATLPFKQHSDIPVQLGCELTEYGHIKVDNFQKTTEEGIFACGDNSNMMRSLANAVASGTMAGAIVNGELAHENF